MASSRARASDIKLIVSATVGVLLAGFLIAGGAYVATRSKGSVVCGQLNIGSATDVRQTLQNGGPYFQTGGAGCGFWLALDDGDIVAYKVDQPQHCSLQLKRDHWQCGDRTVPVEGLARYPVTIQTVGQTDSVIIDLLPPDVSTSVSTPPTSATSGSTSAPTKTVNCDRPLAIGSESAVRQDIRNGGPFFQTGGATCGFWLAFAGNDIVAYRVTQARGCALQYKRDHWECGAQTVPTTGLTTYPVSTRTVGQTPTVYVAF